MNGSPDEGALIEAVMAGVSAGVIATAPGRTIQIANRSAGALLGGASAHRISIRSGEGFAFTA